METYKTKKLVVVFDILSLLCGIIGICLGILSILALQSFWPGSQNVKEKDSLIITCVCLVFDTLSAVFALTSFILGRKVYKLINFNENDPVKIRLNLHEKNSYEYDKGSFIVSVIGLLFGIASLATIGVGPTEWISCGLTVAAVVLDFISAILILCALSQYHKYENVKSIVKLAIKSIKLKAKKKEAK